MKNEWWRVKLPSCQYLICFKTKNKQTNKNNKKTKNQPPLTFPVAQMVKSLPAIQETWVWSLGREDSPGEGNGNLLQYSYLEKSHGQSSMVGYIQSMGLQRAGHNWVTFLSSFFPLTCAWPDLIKTTIFCKAQPHKTKLVYHGFNCWLPCCRLVVQFLNGFQYITSHSNSTQRGVETIFRYSTRI